MLATQNHRFFSPGGKLSLTHHGCNIDRLPTMLDDGLDQISKVRRVGTIYRFLYGHRRWLKDDFMFARLKCKMTAAISYNINEFNETKSTQKVIFVKRLYHTIL